MKLTKEISLRDFEPWSGAVSTFEALSTSELDQLESELEQLYPDGMDETELNDLFWFEEDEVFRLVGHISDDEEETEDDEE